MKLNRYIVISFVCMIQSCSFIHFMGTKDPVDKSESEIANYLQQEGFEFHDYSFQLPKENIDSLGVKNHVLDVWKFERGTEQSTIQLRIYDSTGHLINGYAQCYGEMNRINILSEKEFKKFTQFPNNYALVFSDEPKIWNLSFAQQQIIQNKSAEKKYTFVIYWNIWSNHYSKVIFKNLKKYLNKYDMRENSLIIFVNTDNIPHSDLQQ